jgi:DNA (cytosine-5)-methyltransferase 1
VTLSKGTPVNGLDLCAGIGGLSLGLAAALPGYRTVCYVEREGFCAGILAARMADGRLHDAPIWSDLATFDGRPWRGVVDIVTAGYPCQPFSVAGRRAGDKDERHLWPHIARVLAETRPAVAFLENVPGHVSLGLRDVCADLRGLGYDVSAGIFSAAEVGAPHLRKRLFILATHAERATLRNQPGGSSGPQRGSATEPANHGCQGAVAHATGTRRMQGRCEARRSVWHEAWGPQFERLGGDVAHAHNKQRQGNASGWCFEPDVGRVADGVPFRVDRLRALGNAVVPATATLAWRTLSSSWPV